MQCGFCIPGMVISAKGLIDQNPDPTREEAAFAIRNNICRCTGYVKIIDGILLAAKILREGKIPEKKEDFQVGSRVHRIDVAEKVQGYGKYPDDVYIEGMCYGGAVRSQYPRARVLYIRTKEAEELPGVVCVLTAKDIPGQQNVGHIQKDQPTLIGEGEITQYLGDAVALVCARDLETLEQAKKLVRVVYEELPAVYGPEEASAPGAPEVIMGNRGNLQAHRHVVRGNADEAIKHSKYVLHEKFQTPWTEHAFLEPECCVALPLENGGVKLLTTDQSAHTTQHECSAMLGVDFAHCQVENMLVGGGFGGGRRTNPNAPQRGESIRMSIAISFEEAAFGCEKAVTVERYETCDTCHGNGCAPGTSPEVCPDCHGTGTVQVRRQTPMGVFATSSPCPKCGGKGRIIHQPCKDCRGSGMVRKKKTIQASIPAGIDNGQTISIRGQGNAGKNGGPAGDLLITITVRPHELFRREGTSVLCEAPITFTQAVLGAELEIPTIDGKVKYTLPEGTQSGTTFRLKGKGIPSINGRGRGDQYVTVYIETPKNLNKEQKEALKKFAETMGESNYEEQKKFFKKFKK